MKWKKNYRWQGRSLHWALIFSIQHEGVQYSKALETLDSLSDSIEVFSIQCI
jgi:hypothetical protein